MTRSVLPLLRAAHGRIVFAESVSGRFALPSMGADHASKFALEGVADAMRMALRRWGIRVVLVEAGSIDTDVSRGAIDTADEVEANKRADHRDLDRTQIRAMRKIVARLQKRTSPPGKVADADEIAPTTARPKARYLVGADARAQVALRAALRTRVVDAAVARIATGG